MRGKKQPNLSRVMAVRSRYVHNNMLSLEQSPHVKQINVNANSCCRLALIVIIFCVNDV